MNDELKACPFCGAKLTKSVVDRETFYQHPMVNGCHLRAMLFTKYKWNTRPIEDALRLRIAELEESDKHWAGNVKVCMQLIERYESDIAELEEAVGLITTLKPTMVVEAKETGYLDMDCKNCGRARVELDGVCEKCGFNNIKNEYACSNTTPPEVQE